MNAVFSQWYKLLAAVNVPGRRGGLAFQTLPLVLGIRQVPRACAGIAELIPSSGGKIKLVMSEKDKIK